MEEYKTCCECVGAICHCSYVYILYGNLLSTENEQVNISLWPRFKMVFDLHLNSLRNANVKTLWEDDVHPHYVMRRYAEFTSSLIHLNVGYGDGQVNMLITRVGLTHVNRLIYSKLIVCS